MTVAEDRPLVELAPMPKALATTLPMLATIIVVLDQAIATVAIPQMQATLGATPDTISWVLTSYIIVGAVAMPMTGYLTGRFGQTQLFGVCIIVFTISSTVCGMAVSLPMMVAARIVQGFSGAFLMPMSQAFTSNFGWRCVFFINLPIGIATAIGYFAVMPKFPAVYNTRVNHEGPGDARRQCIAPVDLVRPYRDRRQGRGHGQCRADPPGDDDRLCQRLLADDVGVVLMLPVVLILSPVRVPRGAAAEPMTVSE